VTLRMTHETRGRRKIFCFALCVLTLALGLSAQAQQPKKVSRIGVLWLYSPAIASPFAEAFRQGLRGLGYVEGQNIALEERWAEGRYDRLPSLAAELVRLNVDIIVTTSTQAAQACQQAARSIPIVMTNVSDPVESGLVGSLAHPGGNVTGLSLMLRLRAVGRGGQRSRRYSARHSSAWSF
jgi:putative tryptophan/tyrosine transport system substrate-binding protein